MKTKFIVQMDPSFGNIESMGTEKLIQCLFYSVDNHECTVDAILWESHYFLEQECACNNLKSYLYFKEKNINIMQRIIDECHKRGIKAYFHHRISEVDTVGSPESKKHNTAEGTETETRNIFKQQHPDWVIKTWWQDGLWNLANEELQNFKLDYITKIMQEYNFDGICIDFLRHLPCLPPGKQWEMRDCVTSFMGKVRERMNSFNRDVVVGAKLPECEKACHADGFDLEEWVKCGYADFFIAGSRTINPQLDWYKNITKNTDIETYACWDCFHVSDAYHLQNSDFFYGMISNWCKQGVDGVVAFNYAPTSFDTLKQFLPQDMVYSYAMGAEDYSTFYKYLVDSFCSDKEAMYVAERRGGYPFLTGCGGNNMFAPLPAQIPNDGTPLNIPIDVCREYIGRKVVLKYVITNAKSYCDRFKILLNGNEIKDFTVDYYYFDQQIFWPDAQPITYRYACLKSNPSPLLLIEATVSGDSLNVGSNIMSVAVIDRRNYMLDSDSIDVQRAEILIR